MGAASALSLGLCRSQGVRTRACTDPRDSSLRSLHMQPDKAALPLVCPACAIYCNLVRVPFRLECDLHALLPAGTWPA